MAAALAVGATREALVHQFLTVALAEEGATTQPTLQALGRQGRVSAVVQLTLIQAAGFEGLPAVAQVQLAATAARILLTLGA